MQIHISSVIRSDWFSRAHKLLMGFDVLALPSAQVWPFDVNLAYANKINDIELDNYHLWMQVVIPAALIGLPAINAPIGFGSNGFPMGGQVIGKRGGDAKLLQIAQLWHAVTCWPETRPAMRT